MATQYSQGYRQGMDDIATLLVEADSPTGALARIAEWVQNNGAELTGFIPALTQHEMRESA